MTINLSGASLGRMHKEELPEARGRREAFLELLLPLLDRSDRCRWGAFYDWTSSRLIHSPSASNALSAYAAPLSFLGMRPGSGENNPKLTFMG